MKRTLTNLYIGQILVAEIEEVLSPREFIVNFQGDLIRVANQTRVSFLKGDKANLVVSGLKPLSFKLAESKMATAGINVRV